MGRDAFLIGPVVDQLTDPVVDSVGKYSMEEMVARKFILNEQPDAIIDIVDATNLERNLYVQVFGAGAPHGAVSAVAVASRAQMVGALRNRVPPRPFYGGGK